MAVNADLRLRNRNGSVALACIAVGWAVLPWSYVGSVKTPMASGWGSRRPNKWTGKPNWALRTRDDVIAWWEVRKHWHHYAGVLTGRESGVFVVDVDPRNGGDATLRALEEQLGPLETFTVSTPSGGWHYYFRWPSDGRVILTRVGALGTGIDIKGKGGWVGAPGTLTSKGEYRVISSGPVVIAEPPAWIVNRAVKRQRARPGTIKVPSVSMATEAAVHAARELSLVLPGGRNEALNKFSYSMGVLGGLGLIQREWAWDQARAALVINGELSDRGEEGCRDTFERAWQDGFEDAAAVNPNASIGQ